MGRTPTRNTNLPAGMRARHRGKKTYYYLDTGARPRREISLGQDYVAAVQKWAELTMSDSKVGGVVTFRKAAERYTREVLPTKASETQKDNLRELPKLYEFFDNPPVALDDIEPVHVRQYLTWRVESTVEKKRSANAKRVAAGKKPLPAPPNEGHVRANREKALMSHIWNFAREKGLTKLPNPCAGIKGHKEEGRDVYIEDHIYRMVWEAADTDWLRDALDLAYLTGQRPADVRKMTRSDLKEGAVWVEQNKNGAKLRVSIEGDLKAVLDRIAARNTEQKVTSLKLIPLTEYQLRGAFDRARDKAVAEHPECEAAIREYQFRDLRAKAGTDKEEQQGMGAAKDQLGHTSETMTRRYVRHRKGKLVTPTK